MYVILVWLHNGIDARLIDSEGNPEARLFKSRAEAEEFCKTLRLVWSYKIIKIGRKT